MDARLDTFSDELFQVNTRVGRIARRQARLSGFAASLEASEDEDAADGDDDDDDDDEDEDEDASSSSDEEITTSQ